MFTLDLINTVAFGGAVLFLGHGVRRVIPALARYNVPAPVIGGLLVAVVMLLARSRSVEILTFDTRLQVPFMIAFFTTVGFGASLSLLKVGGPQVLLFFLLSTVLAVLQNVIGILIAIPMGMHPLFGVLNGSVTLTGGPATGLAFAPAFEQAGVPGAATVAIAAAMVGIVSGGLIGGPVGTILIERDQLRKRQRPITHENPPLATQIVEDRLPEPALTAPADEDKESYALLKALVVILIAMWIGSGLSGWFSKANHAAGVHRRDADCGDHSQRRRCDGTGRPVSAYDRRSRQRRAVAVPRARADDAASMGAGRAGAADGRDPREALVERYGPAPRAFLVVPMVGAFFIDFANAVIITVCLNIWA